MQIDSLKSKLQSLLSKKRYEHCLRVAQMAEELARKHNLNTQKAYIAGLLHDIAREKDEDELREIIEKNNIQLREDEQRCPGIWHAFAGGIVAKEEYGIMDDEILEAIQFHSMGDKNMGKIAEIVYIADIIEPERNGLDDKKHNLQHIREMAQINIKKALFMGVSFRIQMSLQRNTIILSRGVDLWNKLVSNAEKL